MSNASRFTLAVAAAALLGSVTTGSVLAKDTILKPEPPQTQFNGHISWHEFEHEMGSYPGVTANIVKRNGTITLIGKVDDGIVKQRIEKLATKVQGAVEVRSQLYTD